MKIRRRAITIGLSAAALAVVMLLGFALRSPRPGRVDGVWTSTVSYRGAAPGSVGLVIAEDGRVQVTAPPDGPLWWAVGKYELHLRGDMIEVYSDRHLTGELYLKQSGGELRLLDLAAPTEVLRLRKVDPA